MSRQLWAICLLIISFYSFPVCGKTDFTCDQCQPRVDHCTEKNKSVYVAVSVFGDDGGKKDYCCLRCKLPKGTLMGE